jgi:hypothetical protein
MFAVGVSLSSAAEIALLTGVVAIALVVEPDSVDP